MCGDISVRETAGSLFVTAISGALVPGILDGL
jgi:hypothetical protein